MNIASGPFIFLFMPVALGIYYLIPHSFRNIFLLLISLFFYAWGEPVFILLLILLILLTWLFGKLAEGNKSIGKLMVATTVIVNVGVLLAFKYISQLLEISGLLVGEDFSFLITTLPIGMSFFCFHAISYVVDIYRGQCHTPRNILNTALYLTVFFKMLQGPIMTYREFEPQIENRHETWGDIKEGVWRFAIGFGKKMIIAANLSPITEIIFDSEIITTTMADSWIGCICFMIFLYFDFSGYSDMAIGLGRVFGFKVPENFNYPYTSTSIAEYWRRWHITLIAWFRDYLYYPILLGPSVRFRKCLLRHNVNIQVAKTMQNIFVPLCVWIVTALWHGTNWNYTIWGLVNCAAIVIEPYIRPFGNKQFNTAIRWMGTMLLLLMMVPLLCTENLNDAGHYLKTMFVGVADISTLTLYHLRANIPFLLIGAAGCFPIIPFIKRKLNHPVWDIIEITLMILIAILSLAYLFKSGVVWFLYQK